MDAWPRSNRPEVMQLHLVSYLIAPTQPEVVRGGVCETGVACAVGCKMWIGSCDSVGARRVVISGTHTQCAIVQELLRSRLTDALRAEGEDF